MRAMSWFCAALLLLWGSPAVAAERLAVLELSGDLEPKELGLLTDTIRGAVVKTLGDNVQVMTRENMEVMLTDMGLDADCVSEGACEVETARNLGVDYVVSGSVISAGGLLIASVKLHETQGGSLKGQEQARGADFIALLDNLPASSALLVETLAAAVAPTPVGAPVAGPVAEPDHGPPSLRTDTHYVCESELPSTPEFEAVMRLTMPKFGYRFYGDGTFVWWRVPNSSKKLSGARQKAFDTGTRIPFTQEGLGLRWTDPGTEATGNAVLEGGGRIVVDLARGGNPMAIHDCRVVE